MAARAAGCTVVGLTCVAYERWDDVVVEHPSGARLVDLADIVVDIGGRVGDGIVDLRGVDTPVGPTSGVVLCAAAWAILVGAAERLVDRDGRHGIGLTLEPLHEARIRGELLPDELQRDLTPRRALGGPEDLSESTRAEALFHERMARYETTRRGWGPAPVGRD